MQREWIDISTPLDASVPVWPGDRRFERTVVEELDTDGIELSEVRMSCHTGTHVDAPSHYVQGGATMEQLPADVMIGPCVVVEVTQTRRIEVDDLKGARVAEAERLLLKTENSRHQLMRSSEFHEDYAHLTPRAAAYLARHHIRCVGIDYLSVGGQEDGDQTHRALLGTGVWIIEGLDLHGIEPGDYDLVCLPLKIVGSEGAPARVLLGRLTEDQSEPEFIEEAMEYATKAG